MTVGLLSFAALFGFNGGKTQVNPNFPLGGGDELLINHMKTGDCWAYWGNGAQVDPADLDTNGYPNVINNSGVFCLFSIPSQDATTGRPGNYKITWDGGGTLAISGASVATGSLSTSGVTVTPTSQTIKLGPTAINSSVDYPHNIQFFHVNDEADLLAGYVTSSHYRNLIKNAGIGVHRSLNLQGYFEGANSSDVTVWADRKPVGYYSWFALDVKRSSLITTAGTGDAFTITTDGVSAPVDKQKFIVKFDHNGGATTSTLNLNGTGAKPLISADWSANFPPASGQYASLTYDKLLDRWLYRTNSFNSGGMANGYPPEIILQIAYEIGAHPYIVTPYLTADTFAGGPTDYMTSWATYFRDTYQNGKAPWMKLFVECVNEIWNGSGGFYGANYAQTIAQTLWGTNNSVNSSEVIGRWYGRALSNLGQAINTIFGSQPVLTQTKYLMIGGIQTSQAASLQNSINQFAAVLDPGHTDGVVVSANATPGVVTTPSAHGLLANAKIQFGTHDFLPQPLIGAKTYYVKTVLSPTTFTVSLTPGGAAINTTTNPGLSTSWTLFNANGTPAYLYATHVCCTTYINYSKQDTDQEVIDGYNWLIALSTNDTTTMQTLANSYVDTNNVGVWGAGGTSTGLASAYDNIFAYAQGALSTDSVWGNTVKLGMIAYEGGPSPDYTNPNNNAGSLVSAVSKATSAVVTVTSAAQYIVGMPVCPVGFTDMTQINCQTANVTLALGSPGVFTWTSDGFTPAAHNLSVNDAIILQTTGFQASVIMPPGVFFGVTYYVKTTPTANTFTISASPGGAAINIPTFIYNSQFVMSASKCFPVTAVDYVLNKVTIGVDSTSFTTYAGGSNQYLLIGMNAPNSGRGSGGLIRNSMRYAQKWGSHHRAEILLNNQNFKAAGGIYPSQFDTAGSGNAWPVWDPDTRLATTPPIWLGIQDCIASL